MPPRHGAGYLIYLYCNIIIAATAQQGREMIVFHNQIIKLNRYAISEASEEMSANYAEILSTLTSPWFMVLAIAATVVISIIVGVIAKKVYNKQFANAGIM